MFPGRNVLLSGALVALFAVGLISATGIKLGPDRASAAGTPIPGTGIYVLGGRLSGVSSPGSFSVVVGDSADAGSLASLPGRGLAYFAGTDVNVNWSTGVPYSQAVANGWLLTSSSGSLLTNLGTAGNYIGDVGSSAYQQAWIANVLSYLSAHPGIDGIFIDDVLYDLKPMTGVEAAKYPTQQQWAAATLSFVQAVGSALHAKGYYLAVNASGYIPGDANSDSGANTVSWWQQLGPSVDGLMNEYYQETSNGTNQLRASGSSWTENWDGWQRLVSTAQAMGKDFIGITYGAPGDTNQMTYGKASFLLDWNGGGSAFMYGTTDGSDPSNAAWMTDIGQPLAAKQQVGVGWQRSYSGGIALVNPSPTSSQTFQLPGSYRTANGTTITSLTLQPTTAAILTGTTSSATAAPATTTTSTTTPAVTTASTPAPPTTTPTTTTSTDMATSTATTTTASSTPTPTTTAPDTTTSMHGSSGIGTDGTPPGQGGTPPGHV